MDDLRPKPIEDNNNPSEENAEDTEEKMVGENARSNESFSSPNSPPGDESSTAPPPPPKLSFGISTILSEDSFRSRRQRQTPVPLHLMLGFQGEGGCFTSQTGGLLVSSHGSGRGSSSRSGSNKSVTPEVTKSELSASFLSGILDLSSRQNGGGGGVGVGGGGGRVGGGGGIPVENLSELIGPTLFPWMQDRKDRLSKYVGKSSDREINLIPRFLKREPTNSLVMRYSSQASIRHSIFYLVNFIVRLLTCNVYSGEKFFQGAKHTMVTVNISFKILYSRVLS